MTDLENQIDALVRPFVAALAGLFAKNTRAVFERSMALASGDAPGSSGAPPKASKTAAPARRRGPGRPKGSKNAKAPAAVQPAGSGGDAASRLSAHLTANPGQRMDQLSKSLGTPVPKLQKAIAKLMASGAVRREGERRGIKYYVVAT